MSCINLANRKSFAEQLAELEEKEKKLKEERRRLKAKKSAEERKLRTNVWIETGKIVESDLETPVKKEDLPKLRALLERKKALKKYLRGNE